MKIILSIVFSCCLMILASAQSPNQLQYQAIIRNASGAVVSNQAVGMRVSLLKSSASGTVVYTETHRDTTTTNGLVTVEIGAGTVVSGSFASVNWGQGPYFIKTETDVTGGTNYTISGISQLLSVPYALYAAKAGSVSNAGNFTHYVGELYGGGIVFHVYRDTLGVEHGLIASLTDISSGSVWSNINTLVAPLNGQPPQLSPVNGSNNTQLIINQPGHNASAAALCRQFSGGGFNDWYLPAVWELRLLYNAAFTIERILGPSGKFLFVDYWSSTEENVTTAWATSFSVGWSQGIHPKSTQHRVRAIRAF
jgi:hypothetical protein